MTAPTTGLLSWGQAGNYDAVDDRRVIAALANLGKGLVLAATFAAAAGLDVTLGPWLAVVDCADGTRAVAGTSAQTVVTPVAGSSSGSRVDVVWVDIAPDAATWTITLRSTTDIVGRLGFELGRITVPANANLSSQMAFAPAAVGYSPVPILGGATMERRAVTGVFGNGTYYTPTMDFYRVQGSDLTYANNTFTVVTPGLYQVSCQVQWPAVAPTAGNSWRRICYAMINGQRSAIIKADATFIQGQSSWAGECYGFSAAQFFNAGDQVSPSVYQSSGISIAVNALLFSMALLARGAAPGGTSQRPVGPSQIEPNP